MKKKWYIFETYMISSSNKIAGLQFTLLSEQPEEGFDTEGLAENHITKLIEDENSKYFKGDSYIFAVLKTWQNKSDLDKEK